MERETVSVVPGAAGEGIHELVWWLVLLDVYLLFGVFWRKGVSVPCKEDVVLLPGPVEAEVRLESLLEVRLVRHLESLAKDEIMLWFLGDVDVDWGWRGRGECREEEEGGEGP